MQGNHSSLELIRGHQLWDLTHLGKQRTHVRRVLRAAHVDDVAGQRRGQRTYEAAGRLGAHDLRPDGEGNHSCPFMAPSNGTQWSSMALDGARFQSNGNSFQSAHLLEDGVIRVIRGHQGSSGIIRGHQLTCSRMASTSAQSFCGKAESASTSGGCARSSTNTSLYPPSCESGRNQLRPSSSVATKTINSNQ